MGVSRSALWNEQPRRPTLGFVHPARDLAGAGDNPRPMYRKEFEAIFSLLQEILITNSSVTCLPFPSTAFTNDLETRVDAETAVDGPIQTAWLPAWLPIFGVEVKRNLCLRVLLIV